MSEKASYDYEDLQKALASALTLLEPLRVSRDRLTIFPGRRFSGGYGVVVKASLKGQGSDSSVQTVAVKKLRMAEDDDLRTTIRLVREMKLWAELNHPNVVPFVGFHIGEDIAWLISDWAPNGNVQDFLTESEVDSATRLRIVMDVASGLVYLHGLNPPICHGDIKPGNILINHEIRGMLADFGLSRALEANPTGLTTSKTIKGSLRYMSPELVMQNASHTLASDVWAFGCVALEILTGTPPFNECQGEPQLLLQLVEGNPPVLIHGRLENDLDEALWWFSNHCWAMSPQHRPTMEEFFEATRQLSQKPGFEPVTGEWWSAYLDPKVFSEFNLERLQSNISVHPGIIFLSDGKRYLTCDSLGIFKTVDIATNTENAVTPEPCDYFSFEHERRYFSLFQSGRVIVWDSTSNHVVFSAPLPPHINPPGTQPRSSDFCISGDGRILTVVDNAGGTLYIWSIMSGSLCDLQLTVREARRRRPEPSFDGRYAAVHEAGHGVEIYDTQKMQLVRYLEVDYRGGNLVVWTTNSNKVAVGTSELVKVWDMDAFEERSNENPSSWPKASTVSSNGNAPCWMSFWHSGQVNEMQISRDDALLVTVCGLTRLTAWDLYLGTCYLVIHLPPSGYTALYVSPISSEEPKSYAFMLSSKGAIWRAELNWKKAVASEKAIEDLRLESPAP